MLTMLVHLGRGEESTALWFACARGADFQILVLPITNRFPIDTIHIPIYYAQLMIVDRGIHPIRGQHIHGLAQGVLIIVGIDPQGIEIRSRESRDLKTHQGNVINEQQIAANEFAGLRQAINCLLVKHYSDFDLLPKSLEIKNALDCLVKSPR